MYRQSAASENQCPRCTEALLEPHVLGGRVVYACPMCGGIFLDNISCHELSEKLTAEFRNFDWQRSELALRSPKVKDPKGELALRCPKCGVDMLRTLIEPAQTYVDACTAHGTWFDRQELSVVGRACAAAAGAIGTSNIMPGTPSLQTIEPKTAQQLATEREEIEAFRKALQAPARRNDNDDPFSRYGGLSALETILWLIGRWIHPGPKP
jgi:Zn-finger nucleic acid-binding protein